MRFCSHTKGVLNCLNLKSCLREAGKDSHYWTFVMADVARYERFWWIYYSACLALGQDHERACRNASNHKLLEEEWK